MDEKDLSEFLSLRRRLETTREFVIHLDFMNDWTIRFLDGKLHTVPTINFSAPAGRKVPDELVPVYWRAYVAHAGMERLGMRPAGFLIFDSSDPRSGGPLHGHGQYRPGDDAADRAMIDVLVHSFHRDQGTSVEIVPTPTLEHRPRPRPQQVETPTFH